MRFLSIVFFVSGPAVALAAADLTAARQAVAEQHDAAARTLLQPIVVAEPANAEALHLLGMCEVRAREYAPAVEHLAAAVALVPARAEYQADYGNACLRQAETTRSLALTRKGLEALQKAVALAPDCLEAREGLFGFYSRAPWFVGGDTTKANEQLAEIARRDVRRGFSLRVGLQTRQKAYDEAFALCEAALKENAHDYVALFEFGQTVALSGQQLARGAAALQECLAVPAPACGPAHPTVYYRLAQVRQWQGDFAAARVAAQAALAGDPNLAGARTLLARLP